MSTIADTGLSLQSTVTAAGALELTLLEVPVVAPQGNEVLIRVEASPINPSDLGLLLAGADVSNAASSVRDGQRFVSAPIDSATLPWLLAMKVPGP
jgi:NADPH2:quinone reductase